MKQKNLFDLWNCIFDQYMQSGKEAAHTGYKKYLFNPQRKWSERKDQLPCEMFSPSIEAQSLTFSSWLLFVGVVYLIFCNMDKDHLCLTCQLVLILTTYMWDHPVTGI